MERFIIDDLSEVAEAMYDEIVNDDKKEEILFVGFYDDAINVIKELIMFDGVMPYSFEIHPEELDGYDKEFYVTLDENLGLWCEPAIPNGKYLYSVTDVLFIMNDCNSSILKEIDAKEEVEVTFDYYDEDDEYPECGECCGECCCHCEDDDLEESEDRTVTTRVAVDKDGNIRGFEKTWHTHEGGMRYFSSYSHYGNDQDMIKHLMENFDVKMH